MTYDMVATPRQQYNVMLNAAGTILSPDYATADTNKLTIEWTIIAPEGQVCLLGGYPPTPYCKQTQEATMSLTLYTSDH